jgi:hypothetical protein
MKTYFCLKEGGNPLSIPLHNKVAFGIAPENNGGMGISSY